MSKIQWLFYGTWAVVWIVLFFAATTVLKSAAEAWLVTFPIAWTAAVLVTKHRRFLLSVFKHPVFLILCNYLWMMNTAWSSWERGVRKDDSLQKALAIFIATGLTLVIGALVVAATKSKKQRAKPPSP